MPDDVIELAKITPNQTLSSYSRIYGQGKPNPKVEPSVTLQAYYDLEPKRKRPARPSPPQLIGESSHPSSWSSERTLVSSHPNSSDIVLPRTPSPPPPKSPKLRREKWDSAPGVLLPGDPDPNDDYYRIMNTIPRPYTWPSHHPPASFTPDPSKQCTESDCPLNRTLSIVHAQGPYTYHGVPRKWIRAALFGVSNPPPEIWDAYDRICLSRGKGGAKADEDLIIPFAFFHAGDLGETKNEALQELYEDSGKPGVTDFLLDVMGLLREKEKKRGCGALFGCFR